MKAAPSATEKVSTPLPPTRFSISEKVRVLALMYWEALGTNDQVLGASKPVSVSAKAVPIRTSILVNVPVKPVTVPVKPSIIPWFVSSMSRPLAYPARLSMSAPAPPSMFMFTALLKWKMSTSVPPTRFSMSEKVKVLEIGDWILEIVQVLVVFGPVRVSVPLPPMRLSMLSNPTDMPEAVPAKPSALPGPVRVIVRSRAFPA